MIKNISYIICNTFNFKGVSSRKEYWTYFIVIHLFNLFILSLFFGLLEARYLKVNNVEPSGLVYTDVRMIINLILFFPLISGTVRRLRDAGLSTWFTLLPVVNLILCIKPTKK